VNVVILPTEFRHAAKRSCPAVVATVTVTDAPFVWLLYPGEKLGIPELPTTNDVTLATSPSLKVPMAVNWVVPPIVNVKQLGEGVHDSATELNDAMV
jgi:hypothetical protein